MAPVPAPATPVHWKRGGEGLGDSGASRALFGWSAVGLPDSPALLPVTGGSTSALSSSSPLQHQHPLQTRPLLSLRRPLDQRFPARGLRPKSGL